MKETAKTFVGISALPNKTNKGKDKTFEGSRAGRGAERRRSRCGAAAEVLTSVKVAGGAYTWALSGGGQRSAVSGRRAWAAFGGLGRRSAFGGQRGAAFPSNVVAAAGSGTSGGASVRRARALRASSARAAARLLSSSRSVAPLACSFASLPARAAVFSLLAASFASPCVLLAALAALPPPLYSAALAALPPPLLLHFREMPPPADRRTLTAAQAHRTPPKPADR